MGLNSHQKISLGGALAALGGAGIVLGSLLGWTALAGPWSFLLGFVFGVAAGSGVALSIAGIVERR